MNLRKITELDLRGKGVVGMADTPNLSAREMQEKVEEIVRSVVIPVINENIDNTVSHELLAETMFTAGSGDMVALKYDRDNDGIVNSADNGMFTYTQSDNVLTGSGTNGKFKATAAGTYTVFTISGESYAVKAGSESEIELAEGVWYSFILDTQAKTVNFKSGGAGLNFKIVGGTSQPASPKENTIWVNTSTAITDYVFSLTQPSSATGRVWIKTDDDSDVSFNALKKNNITLKLMNAYQWNGSSWVEKTAYIYKNSTWVGIINYVWLVTSGDQHTDITGGWNIYLAQQNCTGRIGTNGIEIVSKNSESYSRQIQFTSVNKIDVTEYNYLEFDHYCNYGDNTDAGYVVVSTANRIDSGTQIAATQMLATNSVKHFKIDLRSVTGSYYIKSYFAGSVASAGTVIAYINNMKLTR